jgi:hypothetical protein
LLVKELAKDQLRVSTVIASNLVPNPLQDQERNLYAARIVRNTVGYWPARRELQSRACRAGETASKLIAEILAKKGKKAGANGPVPRPTGTAAISLTD